MERLVGIGEAALGVSIMMLRRWEASGRLMAAHTVGGHRRYDMAKLPPEMFRAQLVFALCEAKNVEVVILNQGQDTNFEEDLAKDVLEIMTVFSARLYGSRSRKNQRLLEAVKTAVEASPC
ncbi:hypothetical protein B9J09_01480 [Xylella fastidiosa subsp. pauca]|nr:hypothetical protein B9J09_01480 [Xylella fastidiosa subsp. pauca]TNW22724.1 hypothetical protein EIP73_07320 [Xylella fastidiosa subsp. pauca]TNW26713.1 hypothetical protein EIP74_10925 [Xylella fastidiosa subsp. pauca]